ncbi:N-6 DNA methylase [Rahnella inusitata]|uniref:N-6 DNA methylase n=1 Tax=Rahnella inusitata TaxID=58169 RepID=UPI0039AF308E
MVDFNQYYTSKKLSDLLSRFISLTDPRTCLELSAGEGALLDAIKAKWAKIKCTTIDIDPINHSLLQEKFPLDEHHCTDATSDECINILREKKYDLAVCNPPFQTISRNKTINEYLEKAFDLDFQGQHKIRAEIVFLAINLLHIKENGVLAIIVPELIIKGLKYNEFRQSLFSKYKLQYLVECTHKAFKHTEAKTYILFLKKETTDIIYDYTHIKVNSQAFLEKEHRYVISALYNPVELNKKIHPSDRIKIIRGNISGKICKSLNAPYIHTTNMSADMGVLNITNPQKMGGYNMAKQGDVIISRVGTRVLGKTNFLLTGSAVLSDCVFAIRFKSSNDKSKFLNHWKLHRDDWINTNSTGTCAKHITKISLWNFIMNIILKNDSNDFE